MLARFLLGRVTGVVPGDEPSCLPSAGLVPAPLDFLAHRQTLILGHLAQRLSCPTFGIDHRRISLTYRAQHRHAHRQVLQSLRSTWHC